MQSEPTQDSTHSAFQLIRSRHLDTLKIRVEEYDHTGTGAKHYHLASDNPENVFTVALRTVPMDSTGVAHILEHTALCGSRKFPVRDPFFMMIRRSMNTFMNAMTSSDWTAYPFASQNRKDFNNLLEVYLDAVFFSRLDPLDFAQEGHRLEFTEPDNPDSPLEYKGVVYNEMKGAMSSTNSYIWQLLCSHLFPTTTYHYNSGGDPKDIPELSYDALVHFYKNHYHPSNAIFMTFGDIPAQEHQAKFEALALKDFQRLDVHIAVGDEKRFAAPKKITEYYPLDDADSGNKSHVLVAWLLGENTNLEELYKAQLLASVLLDNSSCPLLQALETTALGDSPSSLCGLEDSQREMSFICGLELCREEDANAIEALILQTLENIAANGIAQAQVEAALHSLELHQREITGDSYPYGLQLILSALSTATHRGDPIELLDVDPVLKRLKQQVKDPDFIPSLVRQYLLDNPHRLTLTVVPDTELAQKTAQAEKAKLAAIKQNLSEADKLRLIAQAQALNARQQLEDDIEVLPKVELSDVPKDITWPAAEKSRVQEMNLAFYPQGTNGLSYQDIIISLPALPEELTALLPHYSSCLPELGAGDKSYLEIQALQAAISGGVHASISMRSRLQDEQAMDACMVLSSKALYSNQARLSQLMRDMLESCRFDELDRIRELIQQIATHKEHSVTSQGHALAMGIAGANMNPLSQLSYGQSGLLGIKRIKALAAEFKDKAALQNYAEKLSQLHARIMTGEFQLLAVAEDDQRQNLVHALTTVWHDRTRTPATKAFSREPVRGSNREAWLCNTQVNFCALAYPTVPAGHEDAPALTVLGNFLRNGFLHNAIREKGGAYGAGASQDSGSASFRFFSYRDPRLQETLDDFQRALDWLHERKHEYSQLEEAILGVISGLDKPASPAGTARHAFYNELFGRSKEYRAEFRQEVLDVTIADLQRVAESYLGSAQRSMGIISNKDKSGTLEKLGLKINIL